MSTLFSFNTIPANLRVPGFYAELDASQANSGEMLHKLLVVGQRLSTGSVAALVPTRLTTVDEARKYFGYGSMLTAMLEKAFENHPSMDVWAIALDDVAQPSGGIAASGLLTLTGAASTSGVIKLTIAGTKVTVGVTKDQTDAAMASAIVTQINATGGLSVIAAVNGTNANQVDFTARHTGEVMNDVVITVQFDATVTPTAPLFSTDGRIQLAGGATNPDLTPVLSVMGDEWYRWMICPYTDTDNLVRLEAAQDDRFNPVRSIGFRAFTAFRGTYGQAATHGDARNGMHVTCMGTGNAPQPAYLWAAANGAAAANELAKDPTRQLRSIKLRGITPPAVDERIQFTQRNLLLFDGISTYTVGSDDSVYIESQITMYQENAQGLADDSLLYLNVPEWYEMYRYEQRVLFAPYARYKLAEDSPDLPAGQPIMTPKKAKALLESWYREHMVGTLGWCEQPDEYHADVVKNGNRLEIIDYPNEVENLRQTYIRSVKAKA